MDPAIERAAEIIRDADALLITAGAGMGVDSGLPERK
jgi:NAD-dependent SIR2 family protein deacetylase